LARLFRDYGERWEIERVECGTEWIACRRVNGGFIDIIAARDLDGLRSKIGRAEREDAGQAAG
jgi:hypothetical protein